MGEHSINKIIIHYKYYGDKRAKVENKGASFLKGYMFEGMVFQQKLECWEGTREAKMGGKSSQDRKQNLCRDSMVCKSLLCLRNNTKLYS